MSKEIFTTPRHPTGHSIIVSLELLGATGHFLSPVCLQPGKIFYVVVTGNAT